MKTAFVNFNLIDGTSEAPAQNAYLSVDGDRIDSVGVGRPEVAGSEVMTVDLRGAWVMPALVDAHVHLHFPIRGRHDWPVGSVEYPEYTAIRAVYNAQIYLATGVTTVMDQGTRGNLAVALREAIARGVCVGPRIVASGMVVSPTGGLADEHPSFVHNEFPFGQVADTPGEWTKVIRRQAKDGVDNVKIATSGSRLNRFSDTAAQDLTADQVAHIVDTAHRCGLSVSSHSNSPEAVRSAILGGVDTIHHGFDMDQSVVELLAGHEDLYYVPTSAKLSAMVDLGQAHGRDPAILAGYAAARDRFYEVLRMTVAAGLAERIALGSDQGHLPPHGHSADELQTFLDIGMSPAQALASATRVAAEAIGLGDLVGTLEPGKKADFLVLANNPLDDVGLLADRTKIESVYKDGRVVAKRGEVVDRPDLEAHLTATAVSGRATGLPRRLRDSRGTGGSS